MPIRAPLTRAELKAIQQRRAGSADALALLWEIKRLRGLVLRADQLQRVLGQMGGAQGLMLDALRCELAGEPCLAEFPRLEPDA